VTKQDPCRFCRIYAIGVVAFATLIGAVMAMQSGFGLGKFGGYEYLMRVVTLSAVRSLAAAVTGSALLLAFVVWGHPLAVPQLHVELPRVLKRAMLVALPGYAVAAAIVVSVGLLVANLAFSVPWSFVRPALALVLLRDWAAGAISALADSGLIVFLAWRYLPRLQAGAASLPIKLVIAWTFGTGLRMTVGLLVSMFLPG
jgi:hypothetical protein